MNIRNPFFLQECGYQGWQRAEGPLITLADVKAVSGDVAARLDRNFFEVRLDRISDLERRFLRAMADSGDRDWVELPAVADLMGRSANSLSMVRRSLIRKGVIYSPRLGAVAYTVPLFGDYMRRILPGDLITLEDK